MRRPGSAGLVQRATQLVAALPEAATPGVLGIDGFIGAHIAATDLLDELARQLYEPPSEAAGSEAAEGPAGGSSTGGSEAGSGWSGERRAAASHVIGLVPHMAAVLRLLGRCGAPADQPAFLCRCYAAAVALQASGGCAVRLSQQCLGGGCSQVFILQASCCAPLPQRHACHQRLPLHLLLTLVLLCLLVNASLACRMMTTELMTGSS